jgi:hypothetical protein
MVGAEGIEPVSRRSSTAYAAYKAAGGASPRAANFFPTAGTLPIVFLEGAVSIPG